MVFMNKSIVHKPSIDLCEVIIIYTIRLVRCNSEDLTEISDFSLFSCGSPGTDDMVSFS